MIVLLGFYKESGFTGGVSEVAQKLVELCLFCTEDMTQSLPRLVQVAFFKLSGYIVELY